MELSSERFLTEMQASVHYPERATIHRLVAILRDILKCLRLPTAASNAS